MYEKVTDLPEQVWKGCANIAIMNHLHRQTDKLPDYLLRHGVEFGYFLYDRNETVFFYDNHTIGFKVVVEDFRMYVDYRGMGSMPKESDG